ncbi:hypothetical protein [Pontibacter sp. BAB1700]|uniref:hypothetical protein n=1 Tax=Pontibacter sp. BAB1700 TaxID=1144253 RepID=UPI00026BBDEB|nr:hypothetical protein [Pontibacter sp. BAB1700]EJF08128.1 hypothetical protein O71_22736 [Pontibacter sp. BAB1700]
MKKMKRHTSVVHRKKVGNMFHPAYYMKKDIFPPPPVFTSEMFGGAESRCGNEKYVRDRTVFDWGEEGVSCIDYKVGGLIIEGDTCRYKPGFIYPFDVLLYKDSTSGSYVKGHAFSDLVVCAIQEYAIDARGGMHFGIFFRSISMSELFVIEYQYSRYHVPDTISDFDYPYYCARRYAPISDDELVELSKERHRFRLYNFKEYRTKVREFKIDQILDATNSFYA